MSARASTSGPMSARKSTAPGSAIQSYVEEEEARQLKKHSHRYYPLRSTKELTIPKEFSFASEKRARTRAVPEPSPAVAPPPKVCVVFRDVVWSEKQQ